MAKTPSRQRWSSGVWVPLVAVIAVLASGTWLLTQQPGPGWGMECRWGDQGVMGGSEHSGMMGDYGWSGEDAQSVDDLDQARDRAAAYAEVVQPGLEVGEVMSFENHYYADLQESDGTKFTEVLIDPRSGAVRPEMGPATMWNSRFVMMGSGTDDGSTLTAAQAHSWHADFVEMSEHA